MCLAWAVGCGDVLTDASYQGDPVYVVRGQIHSFASSDELDAAHLRASIFWNTQGDPTKPAQLMEQPSMSAQVEFPSSFAIRIFQRPQTQHWVTSAERAYAQGLVLIYDDRQGNGRYDEGTDAFLGGSLSKGLIYAPKSLSQSTLGTASAPQGFSLVALPIPCRLFDDISTESGSMIEETPPCQNHYSCPSDLECDLVVSLCLPVAPFELWIQPDVDRTLFKCI